MKFYILRTFSQTTQYCEPRISKDSPWNKESLYMNKCSQEYELPIRYILNNSCDPLSLPMSNSILVSKDLLEQIKIYNKSYKAYESELFYNGEKKWNTYYTMILPEYEIFNWEQSDYQSKNINGVENIWLLENLILDKNKISKISFDNNIFILKETHIDIICTEKFKNSVENANMPGLEFEEIPVE